MDAALFPFGNSDDLLFKNTAERLRSKLKGSNAIDWLPSPNDLESLDASNVSVHKQGHYNKCISTGIRNQRDITRLYHREKDLVSNTIGDYLTWTYPKQRNNNITT